MNLFNRTLDTIAVNRKYHFPIFLVVMLLLTLAMMYFYHPLLDGHDYYFHKMRMEALMEAIRNGNFPQYIDYDAIAGYGYLAKAFYSDFLLIPFAIIGVFTNFIAAYQSMVFTITMLCGIFTYIAVNRIYKNTYAAAISGILYTFCIYRLIDLYHRSALGETIAFTIIPIVFLGLYHIISGDYKKWYILTVGFCLMVYAHTISSVMMFIFAVILLLIYIKRLIKEPKRIYYLILSGIVALPILAYYFLPMIEQVMSDTFYFETNRIIELQHAKFSFRTAVWGMTSSIVTDTFQIFLPRTGILLTAVLFLRLFVYQKSSLVRNADILVLLGLLCILIVTPIFPWHIFPFNKLNFIQFPWRFYEFASFFFAVAGGYYASQAFRSNKRYFAFALLIFTCTVITLSTDRKNYQLRLTERNISPIGSVENHFNIGVGKEYVPSKVPSLAFIDERGEAVISRNGVSSIENLNKNKGITSFTAKVLLTDMMELPLIYYKGYKATLNGDEVLVTESENGLVEIPVVQSGRVEVWYAGTTIQSFSWYITLISIAGLCVYIALEKRRRRNNASA